MAVLVHRTERLVDLHERAVRQLLDHAGLDAVLQDLSVGALQADAQAVGDEVSQRRQDDQTDAAEPGHRVQRDLEEVGHVVVTTGDGQQQEEHERHDTDGGAHWNVARTLQQVVVRVVAGDLLLDEGVGDQQDHEQTTEQGDPEGTRDRVVTQVKLPCRHDTGGTIGPEHVDVRLRTCGDLRRVVGAKHPDAVDGGQTGHRCEDAKDEHHEADCLDGEDRHDADTNDVVLGTARARELGVLLEPDEQQVSCDQREDDARHNQHVQDVEAIQHEVRREVATEDGPVHPGTDDRNTDDDGGHNAQTDAGEQVVRQGVPHEALDHAQEHQGDTDDPVRLTRATERAGEEDAHHVGEHRHHEHQRCPVVHLADEQAAADLERDVQCSCVCARHLHTVKREVRAVVDDLGNRRVEEQRQVDTGQQQNDEAVQGHLAEHERPVAREDLVQLGAKHPSDCVPRINIVRDLCKFSTH